ncbi:MAG: 3-hydroxyacyl-CoA dehydrogenase [Rhodospirillales bacterium]|nr:3-hydroxyacyl-CoA dehydrogenase [Rhodospirillales bacterium]MCB9979848.1 3-hydroxyacyl-CoA dehydrogenase [Rhodospirillales bacterium]
MSIKKVAVIGAGVMGSGIAAQVANAGVPVVLLDIVPKDAADRSVIAKGAIQKMLKADPAPFMLPENAALITPGNLEDDLELLRTCDWIIEVVLEDLKVKHATYEKINKYRKKGSVVSSNTSTIPLELLTKGFDKAFQEDFLITHFFNPPRYMRLLEIVTGAKTNKDAAQKVIDFCDVNLGKGIVPCHDTPGFIANRIGVFWLTTALNKALEMNVPVELADAVMGKPVGIPKTAVFGLLDLIGIDLMPHLAESLLSTLPKGDAYRKVYVDHPLIHKMIAAGYTGRKGKGGFYRLDPSAAGQKTKQALALNAQKFDEKFYRTAQKGSSPAIEAGKQGLKAVVTQENDLASRYAWEVLRDMLHYTLCLVPEIADDIVAVDEAMKLGYNWKFGPFEMLDALGPEWFAAKLKEEGGSVPPLLKKVAQGTFYQITDGVQHYFGTDGLYHKILRPKGVLLLKDIKLSSEPIISNKSASLWDVGNGVACFEKHSKMNTFDEQIFELLEQTIKLLSVEKSPYKALVIYNEGSHFSAGANLGLALFSVNVALWAQVQEFIDRGQKIFTALKFAPFPVVAAPSGFAFGGGCEIMLNSDAVQAHAETYCGLVEVGVGVIPGWGGCKEMLLRYQECEKAQHKDLWFSPDTSPMGSVRKAFETIAVATVAKSAQEAQKIGYFRPTDGVTMNRDRLLFDARKKALALAKNYAAPEKRTDIRLPGPSGKMALDMAVSDLHKSGKATDYDVVVSDRLAYVLSGGDQADWTNPLSEDDLLRLERDQFMDLLHNKGTLDRIEYMLDNGKPLRN